MKKSWYFLILLALIACAVLAPVSVSERQQLIFPLCLLLVWLMARRFTLRFPPILFAAALGAWLLTFAHFSLKLPSDLPLEQAPFGYLNIVDSEVAGFDLKPFFQRFNEIAVVYGLPRLRLRADETRPQLEVSRHYVSGYQGLFEVNAAHGHLAVKFDAPRQARIKKADKLLRAYQIPSGAAQRVDLPGSNFALYLSEASNSLRMQALPEDLALHFLVWFTEGLRGSTAIADDSLLDRERRRAAFKNAVDQLGPWISNSPRGLAEFFRAQFDLHEAAFGPQFEPGAAACAEQGYGSAAGMAQAKSEPETFAAIFNNAAVLRALTTDLSQSADLEKISKWLARASGVRDQQGQLTVSARIALINFHILRRQGILQ